MGGTNSFVDQFLHPSLVLSLRSIPRMQTVQGPEQFSSLVQCRRTVSVYLADQETQRDVNIAVTFFRRQVKYFSLEVNLDIELLKSFLGHK